MPVTPCSKLTLSPIEFKEIIHLRPRLGKLPFTEAKIGQTRGENTLATQYPIPITRRGKILDFNNVLRYKEMLTTEIARNNKKHR